MKKNRVFNLIIFVLVSLLLFTACNGFNATNTIKWLERERLEYAVSVIDDFKYAENVGEPTLYVPDSQFSNGIFVSQIEKQPDKKDGKDYWVYKSILQFSAYYQADLISGTHNGVVEQKTVGGATVDFVRFDDSVVVETEFFSIDRPISTIKTVHQTTVSYIKNQFGDIEIGQPVELDYQIKADYVGGEYRYSLNKMSTSGSYDTQLESFKQNGTIKLGGAVCDNEMLLYVMRMLNVTPKQYSQASTSVMVANPFTSKLDTVVYGVVGADTLSNGYTELGKSSFDYYKMSAYVSTATTGQRMYVYIATDDMVSVNNKNENKILRIEQGYLRYDLTAKFN